MNELEKILWHSWLNKFLYKTKWLIKNSYKIKNIVIVELDLWIEDISFINNNFDAFINVLNLILKTYNDYFDIKYNNITFNSVYLWEKILKNCIIFYNSKRIKESWFLISKSPLKFEIQKTIENKKTDLIDKIVDLILNKNLSVRNLIKIWIIQIRARALYDFLKEKEVFIVDNNNRNEKIYFFENIKKIRKRDIEEILWLGV